jgi:oligopeptide transport system permease protein
MSRSPALRSQRSVATLRIRRLARNAGGATVALILLACVASLPWSFQRVQTGATADDAASARVLPRRFEATDLDLSLLPPFWARHAEDELARSRVAMQERGYWPRPVLGTDRLGRDMLVRLLAGGAISLTVGISAAMIAVVIGTLYGSFAAYVGGRTDAVMMRIIDVLYGLPSILLIVLLAVAVDGLIERSIGSDGTARVLGIDLASPGARRVTGIITLLVAIGGLSWLTMARVIRGQVLSLRAQPFMEACRALGIPMHRQFFRHILPNLIGPIVVYAALAVPAAILSESLLSFLGIGVREPLPSWGNMAAAGLNELNIVRSRWWLLFWPCLLIAITLLGLNVYGEQLRERFDVRRR